MNQPSIRQQVTFLLLSSLFVALCYFPALIYDRTFIDYNRLPFDSLPNAEFYLTKHSEQVPSSPAILYPHKGPTSRDSWNAGGQYHPVFQFIKHHHQQGEVPFWDPHTGLGVPLFANGHEVLFNPLSLMITILPAQWWDLLYMMLLVLCGWGYYRLLRALEVSENTSRWIAVAAPLAGPIALAGGYGGETMQFCLLPWLVLSMESLVRRWNWSTALGLMGLIHVFFTSGMPEATLALLTFGVIYGAVRAVELKSYRMDLLGVAGIFVAGALWTAPKWVHLFHNLSLAEIRGGTGHLYLSVTALLGWPIRYVWGWQELAMPLKWDYVAQVGHFGMVVCSLLILFALIPELRRGTSVIFWAFPIWFLLKNYGFIPWLAENLGRIPLFDKMWVFRYFAPCLQLCLLVLTAFALDRLMKLDSHRRRRICWILVPWCFALLGLGILEIGLVLDWELQSDVGKLVSRRVLLAFLLGLVLVILFRVKKNKLFAALVLALLLFETWEGVPRRKYSVRLPPFELSEHMQFLAEQPGLFRVTSFENFNFPRTAMAAGLSDLKYQLAMTPLNMANYLKSFRNNETLITWHWEHSEEELHRSLSLLNVCYLIERSQHHPHFKGHQSKLPLEYWPLVYEGALAQIRRNNQCRPRAWVARSVELLNKERFNQYTVYQNQQEPDKGVLPQEEFSPAEQAKLRSLNLNNSPATLDQMRVSNNRFEFHFSSASPQLVVISQTWFPGWEARINGEPIAVLRVNNGLQGLLLPAGEHQVIMSYRPVYWRQTLIVSGVGFLLFVALLLGVPRIRKESGKPD